MSQLNFFSLHFLVMFIKFRYWFVPLFVLKGTHFESTSTSHLIYMIFLLGNIFLFSTNFLSHLYFTIFVPFWLFDTNFVFFAPNVVNASLFWNRFPINFVFENLAKWSVLSSQTIFCQNMYEHVRGVRRSHHILVTPQGFVVNMKWLHLFVKIITIASLP